MHRQRVTILSPGNNRIMTNWLIVLIVLVVLVVVLALVVRATRNRRLEQRRDKALEHRAEAQAVELAAERQSAEAAERAARARREAAVAEEQQLEAEQPGARASELHGKADELDPDAPSDVDAYPDVDADQPKAKIPRARKR